MKSSGDSSGAGQILGQVDAGDEPPPDVVDVGGRGVVGDPADHLGRLDQGVVGPPAAASRGPGVPRTVMVDQ